MARELVDPAAAQYAETHTTAFAGSLAAAAAWTQGNTSAPQMMSGLLEASLLEALIVAGGARRVLEIGTFTGVGALKLAEALGSDGRVTTLEVEEETAAIARRHFDEHRYGGRVELVVGDALGSLAALEGPFDLVYIDAEKSEYPAYYDAVLPKLAERGVIVADNLFRAGATLDPAERDAGTVGMRAFAEQVHSDERVHNVLLTIGDGVMLIWHRPDR